MARLKLKCIVVLILTTSVFASEVSDAFEKEGLLSERMPVAPEGFAKVQYPTVDADLGNILTADVVSVPPKVTFDHSPDQYYTLMMVEPDALSTKFNEFSDFQFWLIGNIPGDNVTAGETFSEYFKPGPPPFTGPHRYVFIVYLQPCKIDFDEPHLSSTSVFPRIFFSPKKFSDKYNLGDPQAGNFFKIYSLEPQVV